MALDLKSLRVGDEVTITHTMKVVAEADRDGDVKTDSEWLAYLFASNLRTGAYDNVVVTPRAFQAGDKVRLRTLPSSAPARTVLAIHAGQAWLTSPVTTSGYVTCLDNLVRVDD